VVNRAEGSFKPSAEMIFITNFLFLLLLRRK
jgi:hypothetical protein